MSSYAAIANRAAIAVGTSARLTAPGDNTVLGRAVAAVWDIERRAALRDGAWNFAVKRASLPALAAVPAHGYDAQFQLPSDSLKLLRVDGYQRLRYRVEGNRVLADTGGPLDVLYAADITEPAQFDAAFTEAFALRLACAIGPRIAGSTFDKANTWNQYQRELSLARGADALEDPPREQEESDWVLERMNGTGGVFFAGWVDGG